MDHVNRLDSLKNVLNRRRAAAIGVGPMSEPCVDAAIEIANEQKIPMMLIASRRQIECKEQGGGYVNGWTTETFADYVRRRDKGGHVLLCRDHGGPWQNYLEVSQKMDVLQAMASAKRSFTVDVESGFDVIHLDPSIPPVGKTEAVNVLEMLFELYDSVQEDSKRVKQPVLIEVGTEEQNGNLNTPADLEKFLEHLKTFTSRRGYEMPIFVVAQTGTLVRETRNVGLVSGFDQRGHDDAARHIAELVRVAAGYGVFIKEHNGDYLPEDVLAMRPRMGIGATNIAPEYGVEETRFYLATCDRLGLAKEKDELVGLALASKKWEKWLVKGSTATDLDKAVMAGHYTFGLPAFREIQDRIRSAFARTGGDLDRAVRDHVKAAILRTARPLGIAH